MKIFLFSAKPYDNEFFDVELASFKGMEIEYLPVKLSSTTAPLAKGADVVCCFVNDDLGAAVLEQLHEHGIGLVALRCAGFNNIDLTAARRLGITVCRVPEYSPHAVAEHAVALILDLNRNIHRAHNRVRENDYSLNGLMGFDLFQKTVGVVGFGKIGKAFAQIMKGFGCKVLVSDPVADASVVAEVGIHCELEEILYKSDIISLHCPLNPHTHHLIDHDSIAKMKRGVMLINTSRGGLINTRAVVQALKSSHIGYLGIDVYEEEGDIFFEDLSNTLIQDDVFSRLQTFPNVIITGHQGFFTREALTQIAKVTLNNICNFERGDIANVQTVTQSKL